MMPSDAIFCRADVRLIIVILFCPGKNCMIFGPARIIYDCYSPAAKPRFVVLPCFEVFSFFFMDYVSLGIADDQTESWNFVSVEQFKI